MKKKIEEQWKNTFIQSLGISRSQDSSESNRFQPEWMNSTNSYNLEPSLAPALQLQSSHVRP
jgi:hypothetical protein